ncbi:MAG: MiaB/RimO family radical SAM methylthiotransferase [Candidatus Aminicenantes bacterium]|nr:MiaB/RimO family radical SAM methylthiotransferase [Candidatus Aminicenantes bacterium]
MKFFVEYFGCRSNQAEVQEWILDLEKIGYRLTDDAAEADFGIVNTCSVTEKAENEIIGYLEKIQQRTAFKWLVAGCMVSRQKQKLAQRYTNYYFLDNKEKENIVETIERLFPVTGNLMYHSAFRSRIFLKIQDGCNFRCAFCIVPFLRGKSRSLTIPEIMARAKYYTSLGYKEIVLTGINLSSYGYDIFPRENILNLLYKLDKLKSLEIIRLSSLDPRFIRYSFIRELGRLKKMADSFHFSFQSGSNQVLKRMKRGSRISEYEKILDQFSKFFPGANFGADILVGYPGETDKEFAETLEFVEGSRLNYVHIFPFSPREGTKAALVDPLPVNVVRSRVKRLKEVNRAKRIEYRERFRESVLEGILTEEKETYSQVITKNFLAVKVPPSCGFRKRKIKVKITRIIDENLCDGVIVKREWKRYPSAPRRIEMLDRRSR